MDFEAGLLFLAYLQPSVLGLLLYCINVSGLNLGFLSTLMTGGSASLKSTRHFECSAYSSLISKFSYDLSVWSICVTFLLFEADFMFFFSELTSYEFWTPSQLMLYLLVFVFFVCGYYFEVLKQGFHWS